MQQKKQLSSALSGQNRVGVAEKLEKQVRVLSETVELDEGWAVRGDNPMFEYA